MRRIIFALLLLGCSSSYAASYIWTDSYLSKSHVSRSGDCATVGADFAAYMNGNLSAYFVDGSDAYFYWLASCSGSLVDVGDSLTFSFGYRAKASPAGTSTFTATLTSVLQDESESDLDGMPVQRVLAYLAFALALCLGVVAGQQR